MFDIYNTFLNLLTFHFFFFGGIIISSTGYCFAILSLFFLVIASAILFPINLPVLWTTFLEEVVFKTSSPVSNNYSLCFFANDKNSYPLTYCLALGSIEHRCISIH